MKPLAALAFLCSFYIFVNSGIAVAQGSVETDRAALVALYDSTGGDSWNINANWKSNTPLAQWYGVRTDRLGRVIGIDLHENGLTGNMPVELGNLTYLKDLNLFYNHLTGNIPVGLGGLTHLKELDLGSNQLIGEIPERLGNLTNLEILRVNGNQLTGNIPLEFENLTNLKELNLTSNQLTGGIPAELGDLTNLVQLWLSNNPLTGKIPVELGNLVNLKDLTLGGNQLTGEIPMELGNLVNLEGLNFINNRLTGHIPKELGNLTNLVWLYLSDNRLTGEIPEELENLARLRVLHLVNNQLTGNLPPGLCNIENLSFSGNISLISNCFQIPIEFIDNERKYFEILQDDDPTVHKNVEFILIQENSYGKLWISSEMFHLFNISAESLSELLEYVFYSTPVDPQRGILEYSTDFLGNVRENYTHGNDGVRIIDILCHVYDWDFGGLAFDFYSAINLHNYYQLAIKPIKIVEIIAHEYVHSINSSYAWSHLFFAEGLAEWVAKDIIFHRRGIPDIINDWGFLYRDLPLFPPYPFSYPHANLLVAYIADRVGAQNMKHIIQVCRPGGVCDPDDPDNGDWYQGIDGLDYALSLLDPDLNLMNITLDFHTTNLVNDSSVTLNDILYGYHFIKYTHPNFKVKPDIIVDFMNSNFSQHTVKLQPGGVDYILYLNPSDLHFSIFTNYPHITSFRLFKEKGNTKELVDIVTNSFGGYTVAGDYDRVTLISVHGNPRGNQPDLTLNISATQNYGVSTEDEELPTMLALKKNYPNPFNPETVIEYELPQTVHVRLAVYDMTGRTVAVLVDGTRPQGRYTERFNAAGLSTGTYIYRLTAGRKSQTQMMTLVR